MGKGFETVKPGAPRIDEMNADENRICLRVLNRDALLERNKNVGRAGHHDFQIRFAQLAGKTFRDVECRDFLGAAKFAVSAVVLSTVSGIDYHGAERFAGISCNRLGRPPSSGAGGEKPRKNKK